MLERQSTAALQIIKSSFSVDSDVAFETADVVSLSSRAAKLARMEAEVSVKEADLLTQDSELKQQQSVLLNKLSSEKAALAVKASRASEKAKAATEKVNVLEKKLAQVQLGNEKVTRELSQALVAAESKLADARKDLDELTRLRKEAREVMTLRATIVSMETALKDSEHAKRAARAVGAALSEKVKTLTADFSDAEQSSKATETALRAETAGLRLEIERITAQLRNAQTRVADLEQVRGFPITAFRRLRLRILVPEGTITTRRDYSLGLFTHTMEYSIPFPIPSPISHTHGRQTDTFGFIGPGNVPQPLGVYGRRVGVTSGESKRGAL